MAYVDPSGTDNTSCTKAMPCTEVTKALATQRSFVKLTGSTDESVSINDQDVALLADPGAKLTRTNNGLILDITGTSNVEIYDLEISGASGAQGIGISIPPGSAAALTLTRALVANNTAGGIVIAGGSLTITRSTISSNQGGGISLSGAATFDITNNFIIRNGNSTTSTIGGASLGTPSGSSTFAFNTVADNQIQNSVILAGGVLCDASEFTAANNIIVRNFVNNDPLKSNANINGQCTYPTSSIAPNVAGLDFVSPDNAPLDYHIRGTSTAIDSGTTAPSSAVDVDGETRPQGEAPDRGADELAP